MEELKEGVCSATLLGIFEHMKQLMRREQEDSWMLSSHKAAGGRGETEVFIEYNFSHC